MLVLVTGMPGSGKTVLANVARELGFSVFSMGDVVRDYAARRGIREPREVVRFADEEREREGKDIWAVRTAERISDSGARMVLVDGVRSRFEVDVFERTLGEKPIVLAVVAPRMERYRRILGRGRVDDPSSLSVVLERDWRELSWGIGELISMADMYVVNDGTLEEFVEKSKKKLRMLISRENRAGTA